MTQEDKKLLIRDLSGRLPYGVKISVNNNVNTLEGIHIPDGVIEFNGCLSCEVEEIKPYLFPISSMTLEQLRELQNLFPSGMYYGYDSNNNLYINISDGHDDDCYYSSFLTIQDWLDSHHIDYRGLISRGLALDATGLNIY